MTLPFWVTDLAEGFWAAAGMREPFPRLLRCAATRALPLGLVFLPGLRLETVQEWLARNRIGCPLGDADRPLRACLAARAGDGLVFIDGSDPEDEQRYSLAHELAHYLRHYAQPRARARHHLGESVTEVLDGLRPPTASERLHALLKDVPLGFHLHLMRRGPCPGVWDMGVAGAEQEADRLAYELLAPAHAVLAYGRESPQPGGDGGLAKVLQAVFGLPAAQAQDYSRLLVPPRREDSLLRRLRS